MTDHREPVDAAGAPPPPGANSPVPADAAARAAAAGRAKRLAEQPPPKRDELVPTTAVENRAQDRARARRERLGLGGMPSQQIANPGVGMPGQLLPPGLVPAYAESMPQRFVPVGWQVQNPTVGRPIGGAPIVQQRPAAVQPASSQPASDMPGVAGAQPMPQRAGPYGAVPYGTSPYGAVPFGTSPYGAVPFGTSPDGATPYPAPPYGASPNGPLPYGPLPYGGVPYGMPYPPLQPMLPPRVAWTPKQRRTALLSSWLGQTVMAFATHLLTAFCLIVAFALLLHMSGDSSDFEADSFTAIIARWTMPDRVWATSIIGLLIGGGILAAGWLLQALWGTSAGLAKQHRATWLAWLCTTAATGVVGFAVWPIALVGGLMVVLLSNDASLTTGTMWSVLFWELGIAAALTGGVGLLFGWLFSSQSRPRVDERAIALAEEEEARAADEAELTELRLRWETSTVATSGADPGLAPR